MPKRSRARPAWPWTAADWARAWPPTSSPTGYAPCPSYAIECMGDVRVGGTARAIRSVERYRQRQAGFVAAMMARAGFECGPAAVAGRNGIVEVIAPKADHAAITRDFGKHWEVLGNAYKPYPCGIVIHSAIDACLELVRKHKPNPDDIAEVAFDVTPGALALCWRKLPDSELEAQVSLYHWLAAR